MKKIPLLFIIVVLLTFGTSRHLVAQRLLTDQEFWQPIAQLPSRPSDITSAFAATDNALFVTNNVGLLRSDNNGATWLPVALNQATRTFVVAASGKTVYTSSFLSRDEGTTWLPYSIPVETRIAAAENGRFVVGGFGGLFRFTAQGGEPQRVLSSTNASLTALSVQDGRAFVASVSGRIFFTQNIWAEQVTWETGSIPVQNIYDFTIRLSSTGSITAFAATDKGVWYSTSFGTWQQSSLTEVVYDMCLSGETLFAGTATNGVVRSTDNGITWQQTSLRGITINVMDNIKGRVFAGTFGNGVYYSDNGGMTWQNTSVPEAPIFNPVAQYAFSTYYVASSEAIYVASKLEGTWRRDTLPKPYSTGSFLPLSSSRVLNAHTLSGIIRSDDNGRTWVQTPTMTSGTIGLTSFGTAIFTARSNDGVYRSLDNGITWTKVLTANVFSPTFFSSGSTVFYNDPLSALLQSQDNGTTWQPVNVNLAPVRSLNRPIAVNGSIILANTFAGAYVNPTILRSDNGGVTWRAQETNVINFQQWLAVGRWWYGLKLFNDTSPSGIYASADTGKVWKLITTATVSNLALDENNFLWGMSGNTVVRSTRNAITSVQGNQSQMAAFPQTISFPNPTSDETQVLFSLQSPSEVSVTVYNALGNEVWRSEKKFYPSGEQRISVDTRGLPSGVYTYRLTAEGGHSVGRVVVVR